MSRLQAVLNGGRLDAHIRAAEAEKLRKYPLDELAQPLAGVKVIPFVVGMDGETGKHARDLLTAWTHIAVPTHSFCPLVVKQRRATLLWKWRVRIGIALVRGKIAQYTAARKVLMKPSNIQGGSSAAGLPAADPGQ